MSDFKDFASSTIPANFALAVAEQSGGLTTVTEEVVPIITQVILMGMTDYAALMKKKEKPIAVVVDDLKGNPVFGIKVEFLEGTEDNPEGSWCPTWTFDKDDFADCDIYKCSEAKSYKFFTDRGKAYRMTFYTPSGAHVAALAFANTMYKWLDENADPNKEVGVELPGFFTASVSVVDDKKVMAFSVDEEISNLIKDDAALQVQ